MHILKTLRVKPWLPAELEPEASLPSALLTKE